MSASQPPRTETRRYRFDAEYTADAANMAASGWLVTDLRRLPDNTIIATYTYGAAPTTVPLNLPSGPSAPPLGAPPASSFTASPPYQPAQRPIRPNWPFPSTADPAVVRRNNRIVLGVIAGLVILCCVVGIINGSISPASSSAADASATATAGASATSIEATQAVMSATEAVFYATATASALKNPPPPPPVLVSGAELGGPLTDFDATYGAEFGQYIWDATIAGQQVQITVFPTHPNDSLDGQDRAAGITITGQSGSAWGTTTDAAIVASFLPDDATHVRTGAGYGQLGTDHVYMSRQLANALDASVFQASNGQQLTPGTFDWQCSTASTTPPFCQIGPTVNS